MPKIKAKCHVCEMIFKSEQPPACCMYCGADLLDPSSESAQMKPLSIEYDGWNGPLVLTNKRLFFVKLVKVGGAGRALGGMVGGIITAVETMAAKGERLGLSIPHGTVQSVDIVKKVFGRNLVIQINDQTKFTLPIPKKQIEEWKSAIIQYNQ